MAQITHKGNTVNSAGSLPAVGSKAPDFELTGLDLGTILLADFAGKNLVLNIFPSIDTGVCAASVRQFNQRAASLSNTAVLCVSKDLPFAQKRFCGAEGIENVKMGAEYKNDGFTTNYHVKLMDGGLAGLMSRAVVVINAEGTVVHTEQVPDIAQEPDYDKALAVL
jgi:thiol peroxidase